VIFYFNVSHAYSVFSIQDSVLSKFPIFCANSHIQGMIDLRASFSLHQKKKPNTMALYS